MDKVETQIESIRSIIISNIIHFQSENPLEFETYNFKYNHRARLSSKYDFDTTPNKHYEIVFLSYSSILIRFDTLNKVYGY